jgi:hypothetical protein
MLATVSKLRRLLRKADLATKLERVIGVKIFYTAGRISSPLDLPKEVLQQPLVSRT